MFRIAIVLCDDLGRRISSEFASYETLYKEFLSLAAPEECHFSVFRAHHGELPRNVSEFDAILMGGSRSGVYEQHEWIPPLLDMIRTAVHSKVTTLGICFGHQAIATQTYECRGLGGSPDVEQLHLIAFHQDQVHTIPDGTSCYLTSTGCEIAGLAGENIFTMQPHPEFTPEVTSAILNASRGDRFSESVIDDAIARLDVALSATRASQLFWSAIQTEGKSSSPVAVTATTE
ncbi:MAG: hypothetical protein ACO3HT_09985 [Ilumatobacteraceae bacterium]